VELASAGIPGGVNPVEIMGHHPRRAQAEDAENVKRGRATVKVFGGNGGGRWAVVQDYLLGTFFGIASNAFLGLEGQNGEVFNGVALKGSEMQELL
jgi:hypothetical protein